MLRSAYPHNSRDCNTYRSVAARAGMLVVNVTNIISAKMTRNIVKRWHSLHRPVTATDSAASVTHSQL